MDTVKLGRSGLDVSRICLGTMSYGAPGGRWQPWAMGEEESRPFIRQAIELGINFFDTANVYSLGKSEEVVGRALKEFARREEVVIATKLCGPMREGPNASGTSRKAVMTEIDASLKRLGTDYVDLYQIHRFDSSTPMEETMEALHDVVKAGQARYIGASTMWAWQFAKCQAIAARQGWTRFVSMQNFVNLLYREEEREMIPLCKDEGVGLIPWSPLARGRLARPWDSGPTARSENDAVGEKIFAASAEVDRQIVARVEEIATRRGVPMAQVALAWVLAKPEVSAPIVGATKPEHLTDAVGALEVKLEPEEIAALEEPYKPRKVEGFFP